MICPQCKKTIADGAMLCIHCKEYQYEEVLQNWKAEIEQVVCGYEIHRGLVHGLQKDAIQNGWGNRLERKARNWSFRFELIKNSKGAIFLAMTDAHGKGLTGKIMSAQEIPDDLPEDERLTRFEHMKFSGGNQQGAGMFGRGKLLFQAVSKSQHIIYDSLTSENQYRLNERKLDGRRLKHYPRALEGTSAKQRLSELTDGIFEPLKTSGVRVIVVDPRDEVINSIQEGAFLKYIEETWWPIILKYPIDGIYVNDGRKTQKAKCPEIMRRLYEEDLNNKKWKHKKFEIKFDYGTEKVSVKRAILALSPEPLGEEYRGICLYRREMKIAAIELKGVPEEMQERLHGIVEVGTPSRFEDIYISDAIEGPEHYSVSYNKGLMRKLRKELQREFDQTKMEWGYGVSPSQSKENVEKAMHDALDRLHEKMNELGLSVGGRNRQRRISANLESIEFESGSQELQLGQAIRKIVFRIKNDTGSDESLKVIVSVRRFGGDTVQILEKKLTIGSKKDELINAPDFIVDRNKYQLGDKLLLSCQAKSALTEKLEAKRNIPFYVGMQPEVPASIISIDLKHVEFPNGQSKRRVDYGQKIQNIMYSVTNETNEKIQIKIKARVHDARRMSGQPIDEGILDNDLLLAPFSTTEVVCPEVSVSKDKYAVLDLEKGPVILRCVIVALENIPSINVSKGDKLNKCDLRFSINCDPGKGIFDEIHSFDGGVKEPRSKIDARSGNCVCLINSTHPAYRLLDAEDDESKEQYTYEQLVRQTLILLFEEDLLDRWPSIDERDDFKATMVDEKAELVEKIRACQHTIDYLYADYLNK